MKIRVDKSACQGHTACWMAAPEIYVLDEFGYSGIDVVAVTPGNEARARAGASACPEHAITIEE
ncbi:MAG: ferredoxin [Acidimicrobiia bacterium]